MSEFESGETFSVPQVRKLHINSILNGKYIIEDFLGEGKSGKYYLAWKCDDRKRKVVIRQSKFRNGSTAGLSGIRTGMEKEFRLLAALDFPGIPRVYEFFEIDDTLYVVREFRKGIRLDDLVKQGIHFKTLEFICWQILDILEYLQNLGLVMSNLDPSKIIVDEDARILITDFRIVRQLNWGSRSQLPASTNPGFIAPELYGLYPATTASDIYSFGSLLYFMFTGDHPGNNPFTVGSASNITSKVDHQGMAQFLIKCLDFDPVRRYQSINDARIGLFSGDLLEPPPSCKEKIVELCCGNEQYRKMKLMEKAAYIGLAVWMAVFLVLLVFTGFGGRKIQSLSGKMDRASKVKYRQNIVRSSSSPETSYLEMGQNLYNEKKYNEAIRECDNAIAENPSSAGAYMLRSFCNKAIGKNSQALSDLDRAAQLDPDKKEMYASIRRSMLSGSE